MTKTANIFAAAALVIGALATVPAMAANKGLLPVASTAAPAADPADAAVAACLDYNGIGEDRIIDVTDDGYDGFVVWIEDGEGTLMCDATGDGGVYANIAMRGDLLNGAGADILGITDIAADVTASEAIDRVETLCLRLTNDADATIVNTVEDGMGDFLVWVDAWDGDLSLCNASATGVVYAYTPVDLPLNPWAMNDLVS